MPFMVDTGLCKKVKIRMEGMMPVLKTDDVVNQIISAQRRGLQEVSVPRYMYHLSKIARIVPIKSAYVIKVSKNCVEN
jgi:hypothetical protein